MATGSRPRELVFVSASAPQEIIVLELNHANGDLTELHRHAIPSDTAAMAGGQPMAFSPDLKFLHVTLRQEPFPIVSFAVRPTDGWLTPIGATQVIKRPAQMITDRSGRFLITASYAGHVFTISPLGPNGAALAASQVIDTPPQAHGVGISPDNRHIYVASMGGDAVLGYRFDAARGVVEDQPFQTANSAKGAGPRHVAISPTGDFLYALTEHHGTVIAFARNPDSGVLTEVQTISMLPGAIMDPTTKAFARPPPGAADIRISSDGRLLFASDRVTHSIGVFRIDAATGRLTALRNTPAEPTPRSFALTKAGDFLLCLAVWDGTIAAYSIDWDSGTLERKSSLKLAETVDWVEVVHLP
ncbi:MAG: lactonase family protein [Cypionkella sp.]